MTAPRMPFGAHRGKPLTDLPDDYLEWLLTLELREPLRTRVEREWRRRVGPQDEPRFPAVCLPDEVRIVAERIVARGFRAVATEVHPDRGGDHERMLLANAAAEALRAFLRGVA